MQRILVVIFFSLVCLPGLNAQNLDIINDKEFQELNKLNPSFTGVLNRFRIMANTAQNTDIGFETRVFKSASHLGFTATFDDIDNLGRKSFNAAYARDFNFGNNKLFKLGANCDYQVKLFHQGNQVNFNFKDFNGFEYHVDSLNVNDFKVESKFFDVGVGASLLLNNIVLGVNINHVNRPDVSVQNGVEQLAKMEVNAQLLGFFKIGDLITVIPSAIYAQQESDAFSSFGLSLNRKSFTVNAQYEDLNGQIGYDFGITTRIKKRHLVNISYRSDLSTVNNEKDGIFSATINSTIFKPKKELEGILDKIKVLY